jgi:hypothetical protein
MRRVLASSLLFASLSAAAQQVVLYEGSDFRGRSVTIAQPTANLGYLGFENRASSMLVMSGAWEFCTEPYFRGECRVYGPGEYGSLGHQSNRIASARPAGRAAAPAAPGGDWVGAGDAEVSLFDRRNFSGPLRTLRGPTPNFEPLGINDAAASIIVQRGTWEFCTDAGYRGDCRTYGPGQYPSLPAGQDDRYSSARPVQGGWGSGSGGWGGGGGAWGGGASEQGPARIRLFEYQQFGGRSIWLSGSTPDFERIGFNDRAESMIVEGGSWTLCSDAFERGQCRTFRPGQYPVLPPELSNRISSAYRR